MAQEARRRHTLRYRVYRGCGALAIAAAVLALVLYGPLPFVSGFAVVNVVVGALLFVSARAAERHERRTHFDYSGFFSRPWRAVLKIVVLIGVVGIFAAVRVAWPELAKGFSTGSSPISALESREGPATESPEGVSSESPIEFPIGWWGIVGILALIVCGEALSDWWEVRHNIHVAACSGRRRWVEKLVEAAPDVIHVPGPYGRTPLHLAVALGHEDIAGLLIDRGADVGATADGGWTALHWAAMSGRSRLVGRLLEEEADVNARAEDGTTPLHWALKNGHDAVCTILREHGAEA